ncbi:MAG TPA: sulfotransferase [Jatrophihabitantaceae bacterium]|nr:sulfotransferase [Jatrophihabitantaceae bacterium]
MSTRGLLKARARSAASAGLSAWRASAPSASTDRVDPVLAAARAAADERLLQKPVFILSSIRSGSTLLRVMLNSHSQIYAPHELHLTGIKVNMSSKYVKSAMQELGLSAETLQFLLWDRLLQRELMRNNKQLLVNKTPSDALMWRRIIRCWPDVRFIYLLRHPAAVTDSWQRARQDWTRDEVGEDVKRYMVAVEEARSQRGGLTVKYEDVTTDPEREMRRICKFIGVAYEPAMVDYGRADHGSFRAGLGDWSKNIKSGKIVPVERMPTPDEIPATLLDLTKQWGYLS